MCVCAFVCACSQIKENSRQKAEETERRHLEEDRPRTQRMFEEQEPDRNLREETKVSVGPAFSRHRRHLLGRASLRQCYETRLEPAVTCYYLKGHSIHLH